MQSDSNSDFHIIRTTTAPREHFLVGRGIAVELELAELIAEYTCIHFLSSSRVQREHLPTSESCKSYGSNVISHSF